MLVSMICGTASLLPLYRLGTISKQYNLILVMLPLRLPWMCMVMFQKKMRRDSATRMQQFYESIKQTND